MVRRFKIGDKIRLKPHTELGLKEYTWGTIINEDIAPSAEYPYRVKVVGNLPGVDHINIWDKEADSYYIWVARDEYVDIQFTINKFK